MDVLLRGTGVPSKIAMLWVNYNDPTVPPNPGIIDFYREDIAKWPQFRLVKYYNLHSTFENVDVRSMNSSVGQSHLQNHAAMQYLDMLGISFQSN